MTTARPETAPRPRPAAGPDLRLSVWPTAQRDARTQRRGRYLPESTAHPAKMLPAIAATAITRYTEPGDLVADPMCGIGTTLVEAVHLGRDGLGIEYEDRWAGLAAANVAHARRQGATGTAEVICGDARLLPGLLPPGTAGRAALVVTSPPYGPSVHGQVKAEQRRGAEGGVRKYDNRYGQDPANLAHQGLDELLAGFTAILCAAACRAATPRRAGRGSPARPWRQHGELVDLPAAVIASGVPARGPGPGRPVRRPARRAARRPAHRPPVVLPARQPPPRPPPRPPLVPDRPRGRADLPQPALSRRFGRAPGTGPERPAGSRRRLGPRRVSALPARRLAGAPPAWLLTAGSPCSGYGGLDLAVMAVTGARLAWVAETDRYAAAVLAHHWPDVLNLGDITALNWAKVPPVDLVGAPDGRARTSPLHQALAPASRKGPAVASGSPSPTAFATYDRRTSSWRTSPRSARARPHEVLGELARARVRRAMALPTRVRRRGLPSPRPPVRPRLAARRPFPACPVTRRPGCCPPRSPGTPRRSGTASSAAPARPGASGRPG